MNWEKVLYGKFSRREILLGIGGVVGLSGYRLIDNSDKIRDYGSDNLTSNVSDGIASNTTDGINLLVHLSMDVEEYGKNRSHTSSAIKNVCKNIDFLKDNLGVAPKYTFFVTEGMAYDNKYTIPALSDAFGSYGGIFHLSSHGRHLPLSRMKIPEFVNAAKTSLGLLVRGLNLQNNDIFSLRTPAYFSHPDLLDTLEREIEGDIILFNTVYNPQQKISKESFTPNPTPVEINNPTPLYFPFRYIGYEKTTEVPLTLPRLSSMGTGDYLTELNLRMAVKSHIENVKTIKMAGKNYKLIVHYVHAHDAVMDFAEERFKKIGIVYRHYKSALDAFTDNLVKVYEEMKDENRVGSIRFLSPPDFREYAISYEQYERLIL